MREAANGGGFLSGRQLTASEQATLHAALAPVLHDIRAGQAIIPDIIDRSWDDDEGSVCAFLGTGGAPRAGVRVLLDPDPPGYPLAFLADQVQDWEVEELAAAGRPATWPQCPAHPDSHPLSAEAVEGAAVWRCPASGEVVARIGEL